MRAPRIIADGRYEIAEQLGAGGFKSVWRVKDALLRRDVALAVLHDHRGALRKHFWREATALSALVTELPPDVARMAPRVVALTDFGELEDEPPFFGPFLVTHLVEGITLKAALRHRPFPWPRAVRIAIGLLEALEVSHTPTSRRVAIVHRDIKPSNIMLGAGDSVTVLDFGVAKLVEATRSEQSQVVGTLRYMAPEQLDPGSEIGPRADLFSVGVVLHEMLTGDTPWDRDTLASAVRFYAAMHLGGDAPALERLSRIELPEGLVRLLERALSVEPSGRPESARQMRRALEAVLAGDAAPLELDSEPEPRAPSEVTELAGRFDVSSDLLTSPPLELGPPNDAEGVDTTAPSPAPPREIATRVVDAWPEAEGPVDASWPEVGAPSSAVPDDDTGGAPPLAPSVEGPRGGSAGEGRRVGGRAALAAGLVLLVVLGAGATYRAGIGPFAISEARPEADLGARPRSAALGAAKRGVTAGPRSTAPPPVAPPPAASPPVAESPSYELMPTLTQSETIDRCIRRHRAELGGRPSQLEVQLVMRAHGRATDVEVADAAWKSTGLAECVQAAVAGWQLPSFVGAPRPARFDVSWRRRAPR